MTAENDIRAVLESRLAALAAKDAAASLRSLSDRIVLFDLPPPLAQPVDQATDAARVQAWLDTWTGPIRTELRDLAIRTEGDLAVAFGFIRLSGERTDGSPGDFWFRTTVCFVRRDGAWRIEHEHNSFPMRMDGSGMAATALRP